MQSVVFLQSPYQNARDWRFPLRGIVSHRIVGSLPSARRAFGLIAGDAGRSASSHFGIGYVNGVLTIDQYVPLDRMAWTNGDVRDPTWPLYQAGVNPNLTTVTIEHEDGGYDGGGVITEEIWEASMELQALLVSGDAAAIRSWGIRGATDAVVAQMAAIPKDTTGFIDHHQIAGPNKPYCLRVWMSDLGFVAGVPSRRDRLLARVRGEDDDMNLPLHYQAVEWVTHVDAPFWPAGPGVGERKNFVGSQTVDSVLRSDDGVWVVIRIPSVENDPYVWVRRADIEPTMPGGDPTYNAAVKRVIELGAAGLTVQGSTGATPEQVAEAVKAGQKTAAAAVKKGATDGANTAAAKYGA